MNEVIAGAGTYATLLSPGELAKFRTKIPQMATLFDNLDRWLDFPHLLQVLTDQLGRWSGQLVQGSATGIITLLLTFYFLFYFLRDRAKCLAAIERLVPLSAKEFAEFSGKTVQTVFASVYATAAVAVLQGLLGGLMFWILGLPSPAFWGVVMGLLAIVPFLGAFLIWVPAAIGLAFDGHWTAAIVLVVWGTVVVGTIDNIVYPILVGKRLSLHPMISFIAIVGGLLVFGAHGIVLGPLAVAVAKALLEILRARLDQQHLLNSGGG
jgi:predicted PurR-regulated permease PerM